MKLISYTNIILLTVLVIRPNFSVEQTALKTPYQRLIETKQDYKKALAGGDSLEIAEMCYRMGKRHLGIEQFIEALRWFQRSLNIREHRGASEDIGKVYNLMSECEAHLENFVKRDHYAWLAIKNFNQAGTERGKMMALRLRAGRHHSIQMEGHVPKFRPSLDSAIYYYNESLRIAKKQKWGIDIALTYDFLGLVWLEKGDTIAALHSFRDAIKVYTADKKWQNVRETQINTAIIFLRAHQAGKAFPWLLSAERTADNADLTKELNEYPRRTQAFAMYYQQKGDLKNAYTYQEQYNDYMLKQRDVFRKNAIEGLTALHENEKKELRLAYKQKEIDFLQQKDRDQRRFAWIMCALFFSALVAGALYYRLYQRYRELNAQNKNLIDEQSHRVSNNLQSVSSFLGLHLLKMSDPATVAILSESVDRIDTISLIHHHLYQYQLANTIDIRLAMSELVTQVLASRGCEHVRVESRIDNLLMDVDHATVLLLIVNELTTNSCKYAFQDRSSPILRVRLELADQNTIFDFEDEGPGFLPSEHPDSFGLKIVNLMIKKVKGQSQFLDGGRHFRLTFKTSWKTRVKDPASSKLSNVI